MAVKVLLKREVPEDKAEALKDLIDQLRSLTIGQPGYVAGETLRRIDRSGECLVISKWKSHYDWEQWFNNPQRSEVQKKIDALLGSPTEFEIYDYEWP